MVLSKLLAAGQHSTAYSTLCRSLEFSKLLADGPLLKAFFLPFDRILVVTKLLADGRFYTACST